MEQTSGTNGESLDIVGTIKGIVLQPVEFFRAMPKMGGFVTPLIFAVVMGVAGGLISALAGLLHFGGVFSVMAIVYSLIVTPIVVAIFGFIGAAILFVIWQVLGSKENYETAYRCGAYISVVSLVSSLGSLPYVGFIASLAGLAWAFYLLVIASVEVHKLPAEKARLTFGIIMGVLAALTLLTAACGMVARRSVNTWQKQMETTSVELNKTYTEAMKAAQAQAQVATVQAQAELAKAQAEAVKAQAEAAKALSAAQAEAAKAQNE